MRTLNEDEFSDDEEFWLLQEYAWDMLDYEYEEDEEGVNPDLYDQYEYMLDHYEDE